MHPALPMPSSSTHPPSILSPCRAATTVLVLPRPPPVIRLPVSLSLLYMVKGNGLMVLVSTRSDFLCCISPHEKRCAHVHRIVTSGIPFSHTPSASFESARYSRIKARALSLLLRVESGRQSEVGRQPRCEQSNVNRYSLSSSLAMRGRQNESRWRGAATGAFAGYGQAECGMLSLAWAASGTAVQLPR